MKTITLSEAELRAALYAVGNFATGDVADCGGDAQFKLDMESAEEKLKHALNRDDLLPCPFCGDPKIQSEVMSVLNGWPSNGWRVYCRTCGTHKTAWNQSVAERMWNKRTTATSTKKGKKAAS